MKLINKYNQNRRDCDCDLECEGCGNLEKEVRAYDDSYFWSQVIPAMECEKCGKSTKDLGLEVAQVETKYPQGMSV
jgi:hypothetical protein